MPVKKDASGKRWVEMELLVPGSPEDVWRAMATGPGYAAWFTRASIEERVGGAMGFQFSHDFSSNGQVTFWEPPRAFSYVERDWAEGAPPMATEITITARSGGKCVIRMVHSLFTSTDDWDDQLEGSEAAWPSFFEVLRLYLAHFAGQDAVSTGAAVSGLKQEPLAAWKRLTSELGLAGANAGERRTMAAVPEALTGVVESTVQNARSRFLMLRLEAPAPGAALLVTQTMGDTVHVSASLYFYGDGAAKHAAASEPKWKSWFEEKFPAQT